MWKMTTRFPKRYLIVILTFICTSVCCIERVGFSIAYTIVADAAKVNQSSKGAILSTFYYGYVCSQVPGGWAAQKFGGWKILLCSFVLWSATCALVPLDPNRVLVLVISTIACWCGTRAYISRCTHSSCAVGSSSRKISVCFSLNICHVLWCRNRNAFFSS